MDLNIPSPLAELDEPQLYRMLGDAWYAQFKLYPNQGYYLAPSEEIGKREYDLLAPQLREDLRRPSRYGVVACVMSTIQRSGAWRMPATVVAALAIKQGLAQSQPPAAMIKEEYHPDVSVTQGIQS